MFPILNPSWYPVLVSVGGIALLSSSVVLFILSKSLVFFISLFILFIVSYLWWSDLNSESSFGWHGGEIMNLLKWGFILFVFSEVIFFVSWFWGLYHNCTLGNVEGVIKVNPISIPTLNTFILLSSGAFVTIAHHLLIGYNKYCIILIIFGVVYGMLFTTLQGIEYIEIIFSTGDSWFGSSFFVTTGFHGLHVLVGTLFLITVTFLWNTYSYSHSVGLECSLWYWHFVDVVWLFLYLVVYWWL